MSIPWDTLASAAASLASLKREPSRALAKLEFENWKVLLRLESQVMSLCRTRQDWRLEGATDLGHLLHEFSNRHASDDRDKVFGLLSLARPGHGVVPDYNLDVGETFQNTALCLIEASKSLDIWTGDQRRKNNRELPSWVPDWGAIFDPSDTRRLDNIDSYNVSDRWNLHIVRDYEDYWDTVRNSVVQLLTWIGTPGRRKTLPPALQQPLRNCSARLQVDSSRYHWIGSTRLHDTIKSLVLELYNLSSWCAPNLPGPPIPYRSLFNQSYGGQGVPGMLPVFTLTRQCTLMIDYKYSSSFSVSNRKSFCIATSQVDKVACVGPKLWSWTDLEEALRSLFAWSCQFLGISLDVIRFDDLNDTYGKALIEERDRDRLLVFVRTITGGLHPNDPSATTLMNWLCLFLSSPRREFERVKRGQQGIPGQGEVFDPDPIPLIQLIQQATEGRVFFKTERGLTGLGPTSTEPGDTINVLPSGKTHFVLRPATSNSNRLVTRYKIPTMELIGDCYWNDEQWLGQQEREDDAFEDEDRDLQGSLPFELLAPFLEEAGLDGLGRKTICLI